MTGFLTIHPANFSAPITVTFAGEFTPVSVVTDTDAIYVGGMLGANPINQWAVMLDGTGPKPGGVAEPAGRGFLPVVGTWVRPLGGIR